LAGCEVKLQAHHPFKAKTSASCGGNERKKRFGSVN
jgi:hypothetical protein